MQPEEITAYIVTELGKHRNPNDIIIAVCERSGMKWSDAQQFMQRVQSEHRSEITGRQNLLLIVLGVITVIAGLVVSIGASAVTLFGLNFEFDYVPYGGNLLIFGVGLAMMAGGGIGLWKIVKQRE
jgi:hypothetical protein